MCEKTVLKNGVRIVCEQIPYVRSASCGIWVESGSRYEPAKLSGISHFIEHMLFKGTETRPAEQIAKEMDAIGGHVNAFTTKENTCYYLRTLDTHLRDGLTVLCDMFFHSVFSEDLTNLERGVILEEIDMYQDSPEDLVAERLMSSIFKGSSLAQPILGTKKTVGAITGSAMREFMAQHYRPQNIVVALAGSYSPDDVDFLKNAFSGLSSGGKHAYKPAAYQCAHIKKAKKLEQNHLIAAFPSLPTGHPRRHDMQMINNIVGGGLSSRLFQEVREQRGLCYTIYSFLSSHSDSGMFSIYTALNADSQAEALSLIESELRKLVREGVTEEELSRSREQLKANLVMNLESTSSHMNHLARSELIYGRQITPDELLEQYDKVTRESVQALAAEVFDFDRMSLSVVGKVR